MRSAVAGESDAKIDFVTPQAGNYVLFVGDFTDATGLVTGDPVNLAGVRVGRVAAIHSDPDTYQAVVVLNIDGRYKNLPTDTSASILTAGLLGEQYIELEPGGADEHLKEGSRIKLTQSAMVLEKLVGRLLTAFIDKPADNNKQ